MAEEMSESKKIVLYVIVGLVVVLSLLGVFIPTAREYITNIAKAVMSFLPTILVLK